MQTRIRIPVQEIDISLFWLRRLLSAQLAKGRQTNKLLTCCRKIDELLDWHDAGADRAEAKWFLSNEANRCYRLHWVEAARMHRIYRALPACVLTANADLFIKGHVPHTELDKKGSLETDKMAQLHIAAHLSSFGCKISSVEDPNGEDIVGQLCGKRFYVECKRPKKFSQLEQHVEEGIDQLLREKSDNSDVARLLAVDCSLIVLEQEPNFSIGSDISKKESHDRGMAILESIASKCDNNGWKHEKVCYLFDALYAVPCKSTLMNFDHYCVLADCVGVPRPSLADILYRHMRQNTY